MSNCFFQIFSQYSLNSFNSLNSLNSQVLQVLQVILAYLRIDFQAFFIDILKCVDGWSEYKQGHVAKNAADATFTTWAIKKATISAFQWVKFFWTKDTLISTVPCAPSNSLHQCLKPIFSKPTFALSVFWSYRPCHMNVCPTSRYTWLFVREAFSYTLFTFFILGTRVFAAFWVDGP